MQKSYFKKICTEKIYFKFFKIKLAKLVSNDMESFSDASSSSVDIEEEVTKQTNTFKPFDMEPRKAIPKKYFALEKENNCQEEINLTRQDS